MEAKMESNKKKVPKQSKEFILLKKAVNSLIVAAKALQRSQEFLEKTEGFSCLTQKAVEK
jgi:hypothetical protein